MSCTDPVRDRIVEVTNQTGVTSNQAAVASSLSRDRTALLVLAMKLPKPIRERPSIAGSPRPGPASRRSHRSARWPECVAEAGLPEGLRFHDLRHTGNTLAASSGASTQEVIIGWGTRHARCIDLSARHQQAGSRDCGN
jgi:integrase